MNNLPNPNEFNSFRKSLKSSITLNTISLEEKKLKLQKVFNAINKNTISESYVCKMFNKKFLDSIDPYIKKRVYNKYLRVDKINKSPCIILINDRTNIIESIAVYRSLNGIKWQKKMGSDSKYIHFNIKSEVIFVAYGIGEMLTLELLELSYILFQSDSITNTLENNFQWNNIIKPKLKGKLLVLLLDNDSSCLKTVTNINYSLVGITKLCLPIQMIDILVTSVFFNDTKNITSQDSKKVWKLKKEVPLHYDFKDYVLNEFYPENIKEIIYKTIENKIKGIL